MISLIMGVSNACFFATSSSTFLKGSLKGLSRNSADKLIPRERSSRENDLPELPQVTLTWLEGRFFTTKRSRLSSLWNGKNGTMLRVAAGDFASPKKQNG